MMHLIQTMKKISVLLLFLLFLLVVNNTTKGQDAGIFESYIQLNLADASQTFSGKCCAASFGDNDLGSIRQNQSFRLTGASVKTFKDGGADVTGAEMNWRVYRTGTTPGSFNQFALDFKENLGGNDQEWGVFDLEPGINLIDFADRPGEYRFEIWFRAFTTEGDRFDNDGGSNYTATIYIEGNRPVSNGNWSTVSWSFEDKPGAEDFVELISNREITLNEDATVSSILISDEAVFNVADDEILTLSGGSNLNSQGTFNANDGKVIFAGSGSVTGNITFNYVDLEGEVSLGSNSRISGVLDIRPNGSIAGGAAPVYEDGSTLRFSTGNTAGDTYDLGDGSAWFRGTSADFNVPQQGVPYNVEITNDTFVRSQVPNNVFRDLKNNLTIESGSGLFNSRTESGSDDSGLFVGNNVILGGQLTGGIGNGGNRIIIDGNMTIEDGGSFLAGHTRRTTLNGELEIQSGGTFSLGGNIGGDLEIRGNWSNAGTFNANGRAVFFDGTEPQTIENTTEGGIEIPFLFIRNNVRALSDITVAETLEIGLDGEGNEGKVLSVGSGKSLLSPISFANYINEGKIEFERDVIDHSRWITISVPISGINFAGSGGIFESFWTQGNFPGSNDSNAPVTNANLMYYDEETGQYNIPGTADFQPGVGYFFYVFERKDRDDPETALTFPYTLSVSGEENEFSADGDFEFPVTYTDEMGEGWNLVSNPFGASLDWNSLSKSNLNTFAYIYNPETNKYRVTDGGDRSDELIEDEVFAAQFISGV